MTGPVQPLPEDVQRQIDEARLREEAEARKRRNDVETDYWLRKVCRNLRPGRDGAELAAFDRGDHVEAAHHLHHALAREKLLYDAGEVYRYRANGVWVPIPNYFLQTVVMDLAGAPVLTSKGEKPLQVSNGYAEDTVKVLEKLVRGSGTNRGFSNARAGLGFTNGFLTMEDGVPTLNEHSPDHLSRFSYDFAFTPDAPHPLLDRFFDTVFRGENAQAKQELPLLLQEFVGACLFGQATKIEKILLLLGPGGNGKSQFLTIARSIFPPGSVSALPPQSWGEQYLVHDLQGRLANFVDEVPSREISSGAMFKKIISGQETHANRKFREGILFTPICGHIFNVNEAPGTTDTSDGFFRRVLMVPFMWKPDPGVAEVDIGAKIVKAEKRALVSWAIRGYARLVKQGMRYTEPTRVKQQSEAWRTEADGVRMFLFAVYEQHSEAPRFAMNDLFRMYTDWCDRNKYLSLGLHRWARRVRATNLTLDDDARNERGFKWNHPVVLELLSLMGGDAPEWGEAPLPGAGTYGSPGADRPGRSRKN